MVYSVATGRKTLCLMIDLYFDQLYHQQINYAGVQYLHMILYKLLIKNFDYLSVLMQAECKENYNNYGKFTFNPGSAMKTSLYKQYIFHNYVRLMRKSYKKELIKKTQKFFIRKTTKTQDHRFYKKFSFIFQLILFYSARLSY